MLDIQTTNLRKGDSALSANPRHDQRHISPLDCCLAPPVGLTFLERAAGACSGAVTLYLASYSHRKAGELEKGPCCRVVAPPVHSSRAVLLSMVVGNESISNLARYMYKGRMLPQNIQ